MMSRASLILVVTAMGAWVQVLMQDDFEGGMSGEWQVRSGQWEVVDDPHAEIRRKMWHAVGATLACNGAMLVILRIAILVIDLRSRRRRGA